METINPNINEEWREVLQEEFQKPYFLELRNFLYQEKNAGKKIFPCGKDIFNAFNSTPFSKVKVVIIGQDPYHGDGQAHGLCFSVAHGIKPPPSLMNIYKELQDDIGIHIPNHGCLQAWAKQGVFLLNAILTVEAHHAASHQRKGWEEFTNAAIQQLSKGRDGIIFLLWGRYAQDKAVLIDDRKHHILKAAHPSPFSAYNGFLGCKHFSETNKLLLQQGKEPINWQV